MNPVNLDLGSKLGPCQPCGTSDAGGPIYPRLHLYDVPEGTEIPEQGKMLVEFSRVEKTESNETGKTQCRYVLEIRKLVSCDCESEPRETPSQKTESILDALLREHQSGKEPG